MAWNMYNQKMEHSPQYKLPAYFPDIRITALSPRRLSLLHPRRMHRIPHASQRASQGIAPECATACLCNHNVSLSL